MRFSTGDLRIGDRANRASERVTRNGGKSPWRWRHLAVALCILTTLSACKNKSDGEEPADDEDAYMVGGTLLRLGPRSAGKIAQTRRHNSASATDVQSATDVVVPFLVRQTDCSLNLLYADLSGNLRGAVTANYQNVLARFAGMTPAANPYAAGCQSSTNGIAGQTGLVLGQRADGAYYGASINPNTDGLIVSIGNLSAGLVSQSTLTLTTSSSEAVLQIAAGDFNGDGKPDLVATILGNSGALAVLIGNGDGTFAVPVRYPLPHSASAVVVDDFNGDGRLDLASTGVNVSNNDGMVTVLNGNGDGTFAAARIIADQVTGSGMISADFNGDGHRDIAITSGSILLGNGDGTFVPGPANPSSFGTFDFPSALAAGDFDNDSRTDIAVLTITGVVQIWRGSGDGRFLRPPLTYPAIPSESPTLSVTDIDGDGHLDVVIGSQSGVGIGPSDYSSGATQLLFGLGDGYFASPPAYERASSVLADFNGDGHPDLLGFGDAAAGTPGYQPLLGDGNGGFSRGVVSRVGFTPGPDGGSFSPSTYLAPDLNGDAKADVVVVNGNLLHSRLGRGDGTFQTAGADVTLPYNSAQGVPTHALASADFNGDAHTDLAVIGDLASDPNGTATGELIVLAGVGDGSFQPARIIDTALRNPAGVAAADFNGDGKTDLAVISIGTAVNSASPQAGDIRIYRGNGDGTFQAATLLGSGLYPRVLGVGDVNGDGRPDVIVIAVPPLSFDGTLIVFLANADGSFTAQTSRALPNSGVARTIAVGDIDGDGHADLVVSGCCDHGATALFTGHGDGTFGTEQTTFVGNSPQTAAIADLNGDGRLDIVAEESGDTYTDVFINKPAATPPPPNVPTVSLAASPATITLGASATLTWSSTDATACNASGAWSGTEPISGTQSISPSGAGTLSYTLTCTGAGGTTSASTTITVNAATSGAPTVTLSASPSSITLGTSATLTWSSTNATACTASGAWTGARTVSGSETVQPTVNGTQSYTLSCSGPGGSSSQTTSLTTAPLQPNSSGGGAFGWLTLLLGGAAVGARKRRQTWR